MTAFLSPAEQLLAELGRLGITVEARGDRLRYAPRSAVTPNLADRMKAHKADLLAMLQPAPASFTSGKPEKTLCRCGATNWRDVPIHGGESVRRDCGRCGRFLNFPIWHGENTGHNGQYSICYRNGEETINEADRPIAASNRR